MIWHPVAGQRAELRYNPRMRNVAKYHVLRGVVEIAGSGRGPINAQVRLDSGGAVIIPRGNLVEVRNDSNSV